MNPPFVTSATARSVRTPAKFRPEPPPTHVLLLHVCPAAHALPHAPQLFASLAVLTSQPSAALLLQLPNPALQDCTPHALFEQTDVPFAAEQ